MRLWESFAIGVLLAAASHSLGFGQTQPPSIAPGPPATVLEVDGANTVFYDNDVSDYSKFATNPNRSTPADAKNFLTFIGISDIVAVNGQPAKGSWVVRSVVILLRTDPMPGQAIADTVRNTMVDQVFEILRPDGTSIGTIMSSGLGGLGPPPPGAPSSATASNFTITGGTGAFLGVRGQIEFVQLPTGPTGASVTEDPARRRANGGGSQKWVMHLIPMTTPEIVNVWHSDFTPVTVAKPARADEILILAARGLGPTRPGVNPGTLFPANPPQFVNSPIEMTVSGQPVEIMTQIGWPGEQNLYRVDFRMPKGSGSTAAVQLAAAWISGPAFTIPVQ